MVDESRLRSWLCNYTNPENTFKDVVSAVNFYQGLVPFNEVYTFNDGTPKLLVNLSGTIPCNYKGNIYNIPICIWIIDTYPQNAPLCFVKPTSDMSIRVSMYVDENGKIYLPYLHDWLPSSYNLLGLIQVMIVSFGDTPPVFAKKDYDVPRNPFMPMPRPVSGPGYPVTSTGFGGFPPYPPTNFPPYPVSNLPYPPYGMQSTPTPGTGTGTIKEEHIRESLLTAIEEKLMRNMKEQYFQNQAELETLKRTQFDLKEGKIKLDTILNRLQKEQNDLEKNITMLKDKEQELDKAIEKLGDRENLDVDDAVTTTTPLNKQLLNTFAEEAAVEDAIYYMGEALRRGVIDLDVFLRQVRSLSRRQFTLRAIMQKCRQKAGLSV